MEYHPRVNALDFPFKSTKIILGSFPTWSLANSVNEDNHARRLHMIKNSEIEYFYGSVKNKFWFWYSRYVDFNVVINPQSLSESLNKHKIAITDMIISCKRKNKSSLDKHLTNRVYNYSFLETPTTQNRIKIICTSKAVLNEMLLSRGLFEQHTTLAIDEEASITQECNFLEQISGVRSFVNPILQVLRCSNSGSSISCLALPSPGSPFRKLNEFGKPKRNDSNQQYLDNYLKTAFAWFMTD